MNKQFVKQCRVCQMFKKQKLKYGKLLPKDADLISWYTVCIDL